MLLPTQCSIFSARYVFSARVNTVGGVQLVQLSVLQQ
jgi:hypothetical protein